MEHLSQWALVLVLIGYLVFKEMMGRKFFDRMEKLSKQTDDLWDWHNVSDSDGVKLWYVRKSLEQSIDKLAANIKEQTVQSRLEHDVLKDLVGVTKGLMSDIKEIKEHINT